MIDWLEAMPIAVQFAVVAAAVVGVHLSASVARRGYRRLADRAFARSRKVQSVASLTISASVFASYFIGIGWILIGLGVPVGTYVASASIIALAVGFGSQGIVQDLVSGLTNILSDVIDVGDLVEIGGQTGFVTSVGLRFVEIRNVLGARVQIPNRTISSVINYPDGFSCLTVDAPVPRLIEPATALAGCELAVADVIAELKPCLLGTQRDVLLVDLPSGQSIVRIQISAWPNRIDVLERRIRGDIGARLKMLDPTYVDSSILFFTTAPGSTPHSS